jgi:tRNA nucleotidyltransferase (CCA-adding enzyme)
MKDALDVVMAWQLRNPSATDPAEAIEAVKKARESDSELPQRLASHFLKLTIPPLFPQTKSTNTFEVSQKPAPWKEPHNEYILGLLSWSIKALDRKAIEQNWHLLVPPILKMIDDMDVEYKAKGCNVLTQLFLSLLYGPRPSQSNILNSDSKPTIGSSQQAAFAFLNRTGYLQVFASTLWPLLTYIPSLTPESESVVVFRSVHESLRCLALLHTSEDSRTKILDKLMREGVLAPLSHFPTPSTYPNLACEILGEISKITPILGIETVKHLPSLIPLLTSIFQDPFILSHKELTLAAVVALQNLMQTSWPRVPAHRGVITLGLCVLRRRCEEEVEGKGDDLRVMRDIQEELNDTAGLLDVVLSQSGFSEEWEKEKRDLVEVDESLKGFFEEKPEEPLHV